MKPMRSYRRSRGITLIEILISLAIGFVVLAAVIVSFVGSGQAGRYQSALTQMNQDAQIALNLLSREVQLAGYAAPSNIVLNGGTGNLDMKYNSLACGTGVLNSGTPGYIKPPAVDCTLVADTNVSYIFGCDADSSANAAPFSPQAMPLACDKGYGAVKNSSGFGVVYEADITNTVPALVAGVKTPTDCLGNAILPTPPSNFFIARNRYFIAPGASGRPELHCASNGSGQQPLLENVEDMQIWYGMAANAITVTSSRQIVRYAKAGKDATTANTINSVGAAEWDKVLSVRICVLMRSAEPVLTGEDVVNDKDCNSNAVVTSDRYMRRAYYVTATLRSKMSF